MIALDGRRPEDNRPELCIPGVDLDQLDKSPAILNTKARTNNSQSGAMGPNHAVPSGEELRVIKDAENLFFSQSFKLQVSHHHIANILVIRVSADRCAPTQCSSQTIEHGST